MNYFTIDHMIVYVLLLITLILGLYAGKGIKTMQEYAVGNKMFGTTSLVLTYLATNLAGASVINVASLIFYDGIIVTVALLGLIISFVIQALFIVPHAIHFTSCITMGDIMKELYGNLSGIITGILGCLSSIFLAGMELIVLGIVCKSLLGIPANIGILVGGLILTLYSSHGGIKSVVSTDVLQFFMVLAGIPLIACIGMSESGGLFKLIQQVPQEKFLIWNHPKFYFYGSLFLLWTIFPAGMIDAALMQRLLMGKNKWQLRNQYLIVGFFDPIFQLFILLIALSGIVLYPNALGTEIVSRMINDLLPIGLKGLSIMGLLAIVMSTVDSHLHVTGLTLVHDVIKPLFFIKGKILLETQEKRFAQCATVLLGIVAIGIGLHTTDIFSLLLDSLEATGPLLMFPLLTGIIGIKPEKKAFYFAMFVTVAAWIGCKWFLPENYIYLTTLISIVTNGISFFGSHFWINKRFKIEYRKIDKYLSEYKPNQSLLSYLLPKNLFVYIQKQCQIEALPYVVSGIFCLSNLLIPHLLCNKIMQFYPKSLFCINLVGIILCILLIVKDKLSISFQDKYLPGLFYCTLLYCLPFTSIFMFMLSYGDICWQSNMLVSLTLLTVLVDWGMLILLIVIGIGLNLLFYLYFGPISWLWDMSYTCFMFYQILLVLFIAIYFTRRKGKYMHRIKQEKEQLAFYHRLRETDYLYNLQYQAFHKKQIELQADPLSITKKALCILSKKYPKEAPLAQKGLEQLDAFFTYYKSSFYHTMDAMRLQVRYISLDHLLGQIRLFLNDPNLSNRVCIQMQTHRYGITCDVKKIAQLLAQSIKLFLEEKEDSMVTLSIVDTSLCYFLQSVNQQGFRRRLPAFGFLLSIDPNVVSIRSSYVGTTLPMLLEVPKTVVDLPKRNQIRLIEAHYGYQEKSSSFSYQLYVLPIALDAIRSAIVDQDPIPNQIILDTPKSLDLEKQFFAQLSLSSCLLDLEIANQVIHTIKHAHQGQFRKSGDPFYTHPIHVSMIVLTITQNPDAVVAALLHDVVEDTPTSLEGISYQYGQKVSYLVQKLTHLDPTGKKSKLTESENQEQLKAVSNAYVLIIKLADRLHNIRTISFHKEEKQRRIAQETLDFYVPLGHDLKGLEIKIIVEELKSSCDRILQKVL